MLHTNEQRVKWGLIISNPRLWCFLVQQLLVDSCTRKVLGTCNELQQTLYIKSHREWTLKVGWSKQKNEICCWKLYGWRWGNFEFVVCLSKRGSAERIVVGWCFASWQALMENEVLTSLSLEGNRVHNSVGIVWGVECVFSRGWHALTAVFSTTIC